MLIKYIIILYLITPDSNYSLSIREDIDSAKQYLKYHGISDEKLCTKDNIKELCSNEQKELCSARLLNKKMEFKQFENPCYMDLYNLCESQDNIWAIKNAGPCVMNAELRRYVKEIEKIEDTGIQTETNDDNKTTANTDDNTDTTTDATETGTENDETGATMTDDNEETESTNDETEITDTTINGEETKANLRMGDEIGKIFYDDGSEKVLRQGKERFPPMKGKYPVFDRRKKIPCETRVKPCPIIYYPVCLYYAKEDPFNVTYYSFINACEAQQWSCYYPEPEPFGLKCKLEIGNFLRSLFCYFKFLFICEKVIERAERKRSVFTNNFGYWDVSTFRWLFDLEGPIDGISSIRAGYCAHIQYTNYARFSHTMSAFSHYGWLHGPWPLSRILKPNQRA